MNPLICNKENNMKQCTEETTIIRRKQVFLFLTRPITLCVDKETMTPFKTWVFTIFRAEQLLPANTEVIDKTLGHFSGA